MSFESMRGFNVGEIGRHGDSDKQKIQKESAREKMKVTEEE